MPGPYLNPPDQTQAESVVESVHSPLDHLPIGGPPLPKTYLTHRGSDQVERLQLHHPNRSLRIGPTKKTEQRSHQLISSGHGHGWSNLSPPDLFIS